MNPNGSSALVTPGPTTLILTPSAGVTIQRLVGVQLPRTRGCGCIPVAVLKQVAHTVGVEREVIAVGVIVAQVPTLLEGQHVPEGFLVVVHARVVVDAVVKDVVVGGGLMLLGQVVVGVVDQRLAVNAEMKKL